MRALSFKYFPINATTKLLVLLLPFLIFHWIFPFWGKLTIGQDYVVYAIDQQLELQYSIQYGTFPLYSPGFAHGRSAAALSMGEVYHPIFWLSKIMPGYWSGYALEWNTFWRLLSIGIAQLLLYILLIAMGFPRTLSFILSFITIYNLRMLDMFRYGSSLESYLAYMYFCILSTYHYLRPTKFIGPIGMIISSYLMICGGHPQIMYIGLLGSTFSFLITPFVLNNLLNVDRESHISLFRYWLVVGACLLVGILLSSAFIIPYYFEFVSDNIERVGMNYAWSLSAKDTFWGTLNSFFQPMKSNVHGAFGSSPLIMLSLLAPLLVFSKVNIPKSIWMLWLCIVLIFLCSLGDITPVHFLVWKYLPFADVFRVPGRYNMLLSWPIALILAWLINLTHDNFAVFVCKIKFHPAVGLAVISTVIYIIYTFFIIELLPRSSSMPEHITVPPEWLNICIVICGLLSLVLFTFLIQAKRWKIWIGVLLLFAVVMQVQLEMRYGTWVKNKQPTPTLTELNIYKKNGPAYWGGIGYGFASPAIIKQINQSIVEPKLARFYTNYKFVQDQKHAYMFLATQRKSNVAVIEKDSSAPFSNYVYSFPLYASDSKISLNKMTYNKIEFNIQTKTKGFFCISFPLQVQWQAFVDGKLVHVYRANGYEMGIEVPSGEHSVVFCYNGSYSFLGMSISCIMMTFVGLFFSILLLTNYKRWIFIIISIIIPLLLFNLWYRSIYNGSNLPTSYEWTSDEFPPTNNLAYGKKTRMSSLRASLEPTYFTSSHAVDGNRNEPGSSTLPSEANLWNWWEVDLGFPHAVEQIIIYHGGKIKENHFPFQIEASDDGKMYRNIYTALTLPQILNNPWKIALTGETARFFTIKVPGGEALSFNEVEIY